MKFIIGLLASSLYSAIMTTILAMYYASATIQDIFTTSVIGAFLGGCTFFIVVCLIYGDDLFR